MIATWLIRTEHLKDERVFYRLYDELPQERKAKVDRLKQEHSKHQSLAAWILWMRIRDKYKLSDDQVFNVSHSHACCICSTAILPCKDVFIGCDIERIGTYHEKLVSRFFHIQEQWIFQQMVSSEDKRQMFYRIWVIKESYMKALRLGMALDTRSFYIDFYNEDDFYRKNQNLHLILQSKIDPYHKDDTPGFKQLCLDRQYVGKHLGQQAIWSGFYAREYTIDDLYRISVCSNIGEFEQGIRREFEYEDGL